MNKVQYKKRESRVSTSQQSNASGLKTSPLLHINRANRFVTPRNLEVAVYLVITRSMDLEIVCVKLSKLIQLISVYTAFLLGNWGMTSENLDPIVCTDAAVPSILEKLTVLKN